MEAFVPGYDAALVVLPPLLSLLPQGSFQLFSGLRISLLGSSSRWRKHVHLQPSRDVSKGSLCSGDRNLNNIFILCCSISNSFFLYKLSPSYLAEHATIYPFNIYSYSIFQKRKSSPRALVFSNGSRKPGSLVSLCYFRLPRNVLLSRGRGGLSERCISDFSALGLCRCCIGFIRVFARGIRSSLGSLQVGSWHLAPSTSPAPAASSSSVTPGQGVFLALPPS